MYRILLIILFLSASGFADVMRREVPEAAFDLAREKYAEGDFMHSINLAENLQAIAPYSTEVRQLVRKNAKQLFRLNRERLTHERDISTIRKLSLQEELYYKKLSEKLEAY